MHGGWSPWSEWTPCSQTCGKALRTRKRTCTDPTPKHNGRLCIGADREEEQCPEINCAGQATWTGTCRSLRLHRSHAGSLEWDSCSKSCGSGIQKRRRASPGHCDECREETRSCNESPCPGKSLFAHSLTLSLLRHSVSQVTLWSDWSPISDGSLTEKRTRFVCSSDQTSSPQLKSDTVIYRICSSKDGVGCHETGNARLSQSSADTSNLDSLERNDWSPWSTWSGS